MLGAQQGSDGIVKLKGLPIKATAADVVAFFQVTSGLLQQLLRLHAGPGTFAMPPLLLCLGVLCGGSLVLPLCFNAASPNTLSCAAGPPHTGGRRARAASQ